MKSKRRQLFKEFTEKVRESGFFYTKHNNGLHLIIEKTFDFWPSTLKWRNRNTDKYGFGYETMLEKLRSEPKVPLVEAFKKLQTLKIPSDKTDLFLGDIENLIEIWEEQTVEIDKNPGGNNDKH